MDLTNKRGTRNKKLTEEDRESNRLHSKTKSRVEHIFLIEKKIFGFSKVHYKVTGAQCIEKMVKD